MGRRSHYIFWMPTIYIVGFLLIAVLSGDQNCELRHFS